MPFGLKTAPSKFQKFANTVLKKLIRSGDIIVYMDGIMVTFSTLEHHCVVLAKIFRLLVDNILELRLDECKFLYTTTEFLGYEINEQGIRTTKKGIKAILNFPPPMNVQGVQSFLGVE